MLNILLNCIHYQLKVIQVEEELSTQIDYFNSSWNEVIWFVWTNYSQKLSHIQKNNKDKLVKIYIWSMYDYEHSFLRFSWYSASITLYDIKEKISNQEEQ